MASTALIYISRFSIGDFSLYARGHTPRLPSRKYADKLDGARMPSIGQRSFSKAATALAFRLCLMISLTRTMASISRARGVLAECSEFLGFA